MFGTLAASITPWNEVDEMFIANAPRKQPRQNISMPPPKVMHGEVLLVVSFDGSARINKKGLYSAVIWKLPEWTILSAASRFDTGLPVNEAKYHGLLPGCKLLAKQTKRAEWSSVRIPSWSSARYGVRLIARRQGYNYCVSKP